MRWPFPVSQVEEVKKVLRDNTIKLQDRGGKLSELDKRAAKLEERAQIFDKNATDIRRKMCCEYLKNKFILWGVILAILTIVILIIVIPVITTKKGKA